MAATKIEISVKTIATIVLFGVAIFIFSKTTDILIEIFIAFVLAIALNPLVSRLVKLRVPRVAAIALTYTLVVVALILTLAAMVPTFIDQTTRLFVALNLPSQPVLDRLSHLQISSLPQVWPLLSQYSGSLGQVLDVVLTTLIALVNFFTVLALALYFSLGRENLYKYFTFFFRAGDKKERSKQMINTIETSLGSWVRGEFLLMLALAIMTFIGLVILGVPYALPLAIFAGLSEALPMIGPTVAIIPALIVALLTVSPVMAAVVLVLYVLLQQIENNFIIPQVMKSAAGIQPLTTIVLFLIGFRFGGVMGALLAVPIFILVREVLSEFSDEIHELVHGV